MRKRELYRLCAAGAAAVIKLESAVVVFQLSAIFALDIWRRCRSSSRSTDTLDDIRTFQWQRNSRIHGCGCAPSRTLEMLNNLRVSTWL